MFAELKAGVSELQAEIYRQKFEVYYGVTEKFLEFLSELEDAIDHDAAAAANL